MCSSASEVNPVKSHLGFFSFTLGETRDVVREKTNHLMNLELKCMGKDGGCIHNISRPSPQKAHTLYRLNRETYYALWIEP